MVYCNTTTSLLPFPAPCLHFLPSDVGKEAVTYPLVLLREGQILKEHAGTYITDMWLQNNAIISNIRPCRLTNSADSKSRAGEYSLGATCPTKCTRASNRKWAIHHCHPNLPCFYVSIHTAWLVGWLWWERVCLLWIAAIVRRDS